MSPHWRNWQATSRLDTVTHSKQSVTSGEAAILFGCATFYDLCDKDAVVTRNMLVANASSNAEPQTCNTTQQFLHGRWGGKFNCYISADSHWSSSMLLTLTVIHKYYWLSMLFINNTDLHCYSQILLTHTVIHTYYWLTRLFIHITDSQCYRGRN